MSFETREKRIERLIRAMNAAEPGSDRRHAVKTALFRLLYSTIDMRMREGYEYFAAHGTVTGRITSHSPQMQER